MNKQVGVCRSIVLNGYRPVEICVEAELQKGIPEFYIVGLGDSTVKESSKRVKSAIINSGFTFPNRKIVVSLSPADIVKRGSHLDFPIAISILKACGEIKENINSHIFLGELGLGGDLKPMSKSLALINSILNNMKIEPKNSFVYTPQLTDEDKIFISSHIIKEESSLLSTVNSLNGDRETDLNGYDDSDSLFQNKEDLQDEFVYDKYMELISIYGLEDIKRALTISLAGGHHILMVGRPGVGKTALSKAYGRLMPSLTKDEAREVYSIYSYGDKLKDRTNRLFRPPIIMHSGSISRSALIGGGTGRVSLGLVSLAHNGLLFIDELDQVKTDSLKALCTVLDEGEVRIYRGKEEFVFPSKITLICATNPCKCGYYGEEKCRCKPNEVYDYVNKFTGALVDRIDMHIKIEKISKEELSISKNPENFDYGVKDIINKIAKAREYQRRRGCLNRDLYGKKLLDICNMKNEALSFSREVYENMNLSFRGYEKILKIGRTIADMESCEDVAVNHIAEAAQYRLS